MEKKTIIKEIQKRLPKEITIQDETKFDISDDEFLAILSWIKLFNIHYNKYKFEKEFAIQFPIISTKIRLDFGLYRTPCELEINKGKNIIYISSNKKIMNKEKRIKISTKEIISIWKL